MQEVKQVCIHSPLKQKPHKIVLKLVPVMYFIYPFYNKL